MYTDIPIHKNDSDRNMLTYNALKHAISNLRTKIAN